MLRPILSSSESKFQIYVYARHHILARIPTFERVENGQQATDLAQRRIAPSALSPHPLLQLRKT